MRVVAEYGLISVGDEADYLLYSVAASERGRGPAAEQQAKRQRELVRLASKRGAIRSLSHAAHMVSADRALAQHVRSTADELELAVHTFSNNTNKSAPRRRLKQGERGL